MNGEGIIRGGRAGNRANLLNVLGWCSVPRCECACASRGAAIGRNNRSDTEVAGPPGNGPCLGCEGSRDGMLRIPHPAGGVQEFPGKPFLGGKVGDQDGAAPALWAKTSSAFSPYLDLFDNTVHIDFKPIN